MYLPSKERRKKTKQEAFDVINIFHAEIAVTKHFMIENIYSFSRSDFDGVTCCLPSFDFQTFISQACIVSALSPVLHSALLHALQWLRPKIPAKFAFTSTYTEPNPRPPTKPDGGAKIWYENIP